jgi:hypothetical protein
MRPKVSQRFTTPVSVIASTRGFTRFFESRVGFVDLSEDCGFAADDPFGPRPRLVGASQDKRCRFRGAKRPLIRSSVPFHAAAQRFITLNHRKS